MRSRFFTRALCVVALSASFAQGQYSGGSTGAGGYHNSTGIAIGAAAATGVVATYALWHLHSRSMVSGCLGAAGATLVDDRKKSTYVLINNDSLPLTVGDRVSLKGKKIRQGSGREAFEVHRVAKDFGACQQ